MDWQCHLHGLQVNLCQKLLFLNQLTHNMTTAQNWGEHVVYRNCFWHSEHFLYKTCSPHFLHKEEILTKIYLYHWTKWIIYVGIETILKAYSQYGVAREQINANIYINPTKIWFQCFCVMKEVPPNILLFVSLILSYLCTKCSSNNSIRLIYLL